MDNNYDIFKYLDPLDNTKLSDFKRYDLEDLIMYINKYYLEYRNYLYTSNRASIGCEIEYELKRKGKSTPDKTLCPVKNEDFEIKPGWVLREDGSLKNGGEIVSPIFYNNKLSWKDFHETFDLFTSNQVIKDTCSAHVHIGANTLGNKAKNWNNFLRLWMVYEDIIYRFCNGEYLNSRTAISTYSIPIREKLRVYFKDIEYEYGKYYNENKILPTKEYIFKKLLTKTRYNAINFMNISDLNSFAEYNTIEFRPANGTLNPIIWQNLINLYLSIIIYSKSNMYDLDIVNARSRKIDYDYCDYNEINLDEAIEFCDLVFKKNIDKIYFLRQYLKDNEVSNHEGLVKAKKFTI